MIQLLPLKLLPSLALTHLSGVLVTGGAEGGQLGSSVEGLLLLVGNTVVGIERQKNYFTFFYLI